MERRYFKRCVIGSVNIGGMSLFIRIHICNSGSQIKEQASTDHSENRTESKLEVFANHLKWKISPLLSLLNANRCYQKLHWTWHSQVSKLRNRAMHSQQVYLLLKETVNMPHNRDGYGPPRVTNSPQIWYNTTSVISINLMMYAMNKHAAVWTLV